MPLHARRQIVLAAVAVLTGLSTTAGRVHPGRASPSPVVKTPFLLVYARTEESREISSDDHGRRMQRELILAVEGVTASADDDDALSDAIALEVEQAIEGNPTLGGLVKDVVLARTTMAGGAEGESRTGRVRLEFTVEYHTTAGRPDISLQ